MAMVWKLHKNKDTIKSLKEIVKNKNKKKKKWNSSNKEKGVISKGSNIFKDTVYTVYYAEYEWSFPDAA